LADVSLDWRVTAYAIGVAVLTVFLAGVLPSIAAARAALLTSLRHASRTASSGHTRQILVAVQVAVSMVLVTCAGLLAQSMTRLHAIEFGFNPDGLLMVTDSIRPSSVGRRDSDAQRFHLELQRRLSEVPGIEAAAFSGGSPLYSGTAFARVLTAADASTGGDTTVREVSAGYFRTMGIPIRTGRDFTPAEAADRMLSGRVIIDELLARQLFGHADAVGRRIWMEPGWLIPGARPSAEVIGVVGSILTRDVRAGHQAVLYVPAGQRETAVHQIRISIPPDQAIAAWRRVVRDMEPLLFVDRIVMPRERLDEIAVDTLILTRVSYAFAVLAGLLALAGAHAVTARTTFERTREFGIRMALGASPRALAGQVLFRALFTAALGLGVGAAIHFGLSGFLNSWLFGISPRDPLTLVAATLLITAMILLGAWLPARRAAAIDPSVSLRSE
jgi:predicted permease